MKQVWVKVDPWDKKRVTTALEGGADAVWTPPGHAPEVRSLGKIKVIAADGDLVPGVDLSEISFGEQRRRSGYRPASQVSSRGHPLR